MRVAAVLIAMSLGLAAPQPGLAQDQTLADIRQELSVLFVEIQRLKRELSTTGAAAGTIAGDTLQRVDLIEAELARLTSKTEQLEFRINQVVSDGTNRVGDLEFRLCELEPDCDIATLGETPTLGGESAGIAPVAAPSTDGGTELAVGEQSDFDRAVAALDAGDFQSAIGQFQTFTATYPGGPLSSEAHFLRGEALSALEQTAAAARAYLESFSGEPGGRRAADALLRLGQSLADLGQASEACVTLGEVGARFPGAPQVAEAEAERARLGCS